MTATPGMTGMTTGMHGMGTGMHGMGTGMHGMGTGMTGMATGMTGMATAMNGMGTAMNGMGTAMNGMGTGMNGMGTAMNGMDSGMDMDMDMGHMNSTMMMYFHAGFNEFILFKELYTSTKGEFGGACVVVFLLALLYEVLKFLREELLRHHTFRLAQSLLHGSEEEKVQAVSTKARVFCWMHILQTVLHALQVFLSYCLMLIFMTYNAYLCVSLILGATVGYFITGWKRTQITDRNEHCH